MVGEQVDRPALPTDVERDLDGHIPSQQAEAGRGLIDHRSVIRIEQAVETLALPCDEQLQARGQRPDDRVDMAHRHVIGSTCLHAPHHRARNSGSTSQVGLPPSPSPPKGPDLTPEPDRIHSCSLPTDASLPINALGPVTRLRA